MLPEKEIQYFEGLLCRTMDKLLGDKLLAPEIIYDILDVYENPADPLDQARVNHDRDVAIMIHERKNEKIKRLRNALERIRERTYGICEQCDEMISKERLQVAPLTTLCIDCKRKQEIYYARESVFS